MNGHLDKMEEECGVFGVFSTRKKEVVSELVYRGLFALQHRGQESAGISLAHNGCINTHRGMGLVGDVFTSEILKYLKGSSAIGHVRYSTQGSCHLKNSQPIQSVSGYKHVAMAHNGNISNAREIKDKLIEKGHTFSTETDSEVLLKMIDPVSPAEMLNSIKNIAERVRGSYSLVVLTEDKLTGIRDPYGIRPLCLGTNSSGDWFLASESCALDSVGATLVRDIRAGEMVTIDDSGVHSVMYSPSSVKASCSFEHIYFARPDSIVDGSSVYSTRVESGRFLAGQKTVEADIVIGVPDSGIPAAIGFSETSGIPYTLGLIKNSYSGRSFIEPTKEMRERVLDTKLIPLKAAIDGKRVVVVDDSLVRGTTSKKITNLLRKAGAAEVHFRIASPPVSCPCFLGIDIATRKDLPASHMNTEQMAEFIGADSLDFLWLENLYFSLGKGNFCTGCFTGSYPVSSSKGTDLLPSVG